MGHLEGAREALGLRVATETEKLALELKAAFPELSTAAIDRILRRIPRENELGQAGGSNEDSTD